MFRDVSDRLWNPFFRLFVPFHIKLWETDFYTPPLLRGAALLDSSAPAVHKNPVP